MHLEHTFSHLHKSVNCFLWRLYTYFTPILKYPSIKRRTQLDIYLYSEKMFIAAMCFYIIAELIYYCFHMFVFTFQRNGLKFSAEHFKGLSYKVFQQKSFGHGIAMLSIMDIFANLSIRKTVISLCFSQYPTK